MVRRKYNVNKMNAMLQMKSQDSNLWKVITQMQTRLMEVGCWSIGDGYRIMFCSDNWIGKGISLRECNVNIPEHLIDARIRDLVGEDGDWKWELFEWLPTTMKMDIEALLPLLDDNGEDKLVVAIDEDGR